MVNYDDQDPTYQMGGNPGEVGSGMLRDEPNATGAPNVCGWSFCYEDRDHFHLGTGNVVLRTPHKPGQVTVEEALQEEMERSQRRVNYISQLYPKAPRPSWDEYFMGIARAVSLRGDCTRRQVGCILVDAEHRIIGTGYNGAEPGGPSCLAGQCPRGRSDAPRTEDYSNCVAIHAEANALLFARTSAAGATAYVSSSVCDGCSKLLRGAGVTRVVQVDLAGVMFG